MLRDSIRWGSVALGAGLILGIAGCSNTRTTTRTTLCRGDLDECRQVVLSYDIVQERQGLQPARDYEQLTLRVCPRERPRFERAVKTVELEFAGPRGQLRFENVEVRADQTRQKVWFFDRDTARIIATLDRQTGRTTGPDDKPPAWATSDRGRPLKVGSD